MPNSRNVVDECFAKLTVGVCPGQWGVRLPEGDKRMPHMQAWHEIAECGLGTK